MFQPLVSGGEYQLHHPRMDFYLGGKVRVGWVEIPLPSQQIPGETAEALPTVGRPWRFVVQFVDSSGVVKLDLKEAEKANPTYPGIWLKMA